MLQRDGYRCQWPVGTGICGAAATEVDHIDNDGPQADLANCRSLCPHHHKAKSSAEGGIGYGKIRRALAAAKRRPAERHPGYR